MINIEDWSDLAWKHANNSYDDSMIGIELEDVYQCAMLGLFEAAQNYDESKGAFSTYAPYHIRNEINKALYDHKGGEGRRVSNVKEELYSDLPDQVALEECEQLAYEQDFSEIVYTDYFLSTVPLEGMEYQYLINMITVGDKEATRIYMETTGHVKQRASQIKNKVKETAKRHVRRLE